MQFVMFLMFLGFLSGCNPFAKDNKVKDPVYLSPTMIDLQAKVKTYCDLSEKAKDEHGFIHSVGDGLLFTSLHEAVCSGSHTLDAEISSGEWCRHPTCPGTKPDFNVSATRLSRDMQLGAYVYLYEEGLVDKFRDMITFGRDNSWEMCNGNYRDEKARLGRCVLSPTLKATLYELVSAMGGSCDARCSVSRLVPQVWDPKATGYRAHLAVVHTDLRGRVQGSINDFQKDFLRSMAESEPNNALYTATYESYSNRDSESLAKYLLDSPKWPNDRLPTSEDYCTEYLFQREELKVDQEFKADEQGCFTYYTYRARDKYEEHVSCDKEAGSVHKVAGLTVNDDWLPCDEGKVHSGTDFLFAAATVLGSLKRN